MFRRVGSSDQRALAERLEREALAARPKFSEALQQRISRRVRQAAAESAVPARQQPVPRLQLGWMAVAVAALVVVSIVTAVKWPRQPSPSDVEQQFAAARRQAPQPADGTDPTGPPTEGPASGMLALATLSDQAFDRIDRALGADGANRLWSDLGHDARLAVEMLVDPLPLDLMAGNTAVPSETL